MTATIDTAEAFPNTPLTSDAWTFTSNSCGYMLYKNGEPQGGVGTMGTATHTSDGRRRSWQARKADVNMYAETAQRLCKKNNQKSQALVA